MKTADDAVRFEGQTEEVKQSLLQVLETLAQTVVRVEGDGGGQKPVDRTIFLVSRPVRITEVGVMFDEETKVGLTLSVIRKNDGVEEVNPCIFETVQPAFREMILTVCAGVVRPGQALVLRSSGAKMPMGVVRVSYKLA